MYKTALQVRDAEVRGVLAAFVDAGLVKVAGQQAFDNLAEVVADTLGTSDYDLQKIANVTDYVLSGNQSVGFRKTAAEQHDIATKAALGELLMMKTANQIDEATFVKEAKALMKSAYFGFEENPVKGTIQPFREKARIFFDEQRKKALEFAKKHKGKAAIGAGLVGAAGAGALGKHLYDKYAR